MILLLLIIKCGMCIAIVSQTYTQQKKIDTFTLYTYVGVYYYYWNCNDSMMAIVIIIIIIKIDRVYIELELIYSLLLLPSLLLLFVIHCVSVVCVGVDMAPSTMIHEGWRLLFLLYIVHQSQTQHTPI